MNPILAVLTTWIIASIGAQELPSSFDARVQWPNCPSIATIPNQGCCDASYALVPAAVITDRVCIQSNATVTRTYSAYDALACCTDCPFSLFQKCAGGNPLNVWNYWATTGLVSESCMPLSLLNSLCLLPICPLLCTQGSTAVGNRLQGLSVETLMSNELTIKNEIFVNGPVEASFDMYSDFATFKGAGVYIHRSGGYVGKRSVKMVGWGTQNDAPYWLVVNTQGQDSGDNGVVKFMRGQNYLNIESNVHAGKPNF